MKIAVGFFDGVHLGHRRILGGADAAVTFRSHPSSLLAPERTPRLIMPLRERLASIAEALRPQKPQCPRTMALEFDDAMKNMSPGEFVSLLKREFPEIEAIRCGHGWRFGAGGAGNADVARGLGLAVEEVPFVTYAGEAVSSTRIRRALTAGEVEDAAAMLGRPWRFFGRVFAGKGEGRKLGFPTVNMRPPEGMVRLRRGVYAVETSWGPGVANWGEAPTMGAAAWDECTFEVHLLDADRSFAPPEEMTVDVCRFIRPERMFPSRAALAEQIAADCAAVRFFMKDAFATCGDGAVMT